MLQPNYGIGMCQAATLLLVPDIPLTDKKTVKKMFTTYFTLNQIPYDLQFKFYIYILPKYVMSGIN